MLKTRKVYFYVCPVFHEALFLKNVVKGEGEVGEGGFGKKIDKREGWPYNGSCL